ncbi:MAG: DUF969 domain-containing protein [Acidobacteria bacterium]|nr:DUF969 domain-containing protein [Acidobacteriota bacterium]
MHGYDLLKLIGIVIIVVGIALKLRTTLVVMAAALATGLIAGLPLFSHEGFFLQLPFLTKPGQMGIINTLGKAFADNRLMTLFIITLPAIGLSERFGLQEQSAKLIRGIRAATVGRLQIVYQLFRVLHGAIGIRLNGHPSFVRPLVFPMSLGAASRYGTGSGSDPASSSYETEDGDDSASLATTESARSLPLPVLNQQSVERIKAANAAAENYGNFYGQNLSPVQAGILLVYGVMNGLGFAVGVWDLVKFTIPVVVASILFAAVQFWLLDRWLNREAAR